MNMPLIFPIIGTHNLIRKLGLVPNDNSLFAKQDILQSTLNDKAVMMVTTE